MKKNGLLTIIATCLFICVQAQIKTKQERGFFNITNVAELQYLRSIDSSVVDNGMAVVKGGFEAHTINGFFVNPRVSLGLGAGIQLATINTTYHSGYGSGPDISIGPDMTLLPVFADIRYYPKNARNTPMFILDAGYGILLKGNHTAQLSLMADRL